MAHDIDGCYQKRRVFAPPLGGYRAPGFRQFAFASYEANKNFQVQEQLFQTDAWGLRARMPGVPMPQYEPVPTWPPKKSTAPREEELLVEDWAARGKGLRVAGVVLE